MVDNYYPSRHTGEEIDAAVALSNHNSNLIKELSETTVGLKGELETTAESLEELDKSLEELDKSLDKLDSNIKENSDSILLLENRGIIPSDNSLFEFILNEDGKGYSVRMSDFSDVSGLAEIVIPYRYNGLPVTTILNEGFKTADVPKIVIPKGITRIGDFAFDFLDKLTDINIPNGITTIPESCFQGCEELCNITIPESITNIQAVAFNVCDKLTNVYYEGSEEQWKTISIEEGNECLENANIHFNYAIPDTYATKVEFSEYTDYAEETYATKEELGSIIIALDGILEIQNSLISGEINEYSR